MHTHISAVEAIRCMRTLQPYNICRNNVLHFHQGMISLLGKMMMIVEIFLFNSKNEAIKINMAFI